MTATTRLCLLSVVAATACGRPAAKPEQAATPDVPGQLQALIDSTVLVTPSIPGFILYLDAPATRFTWRGAAGLFDRASGQKLSPDVTVRLASNTKTYVAASILRLVEDGKLGLDDPIEKRLLPASVRTLRKGGYDPSAITVRDLLQHVSGLYDYATDDAFAAAIFARPDHRWTRVEQLAFAIEHGKPYGKPRAVYHYSDTGYILLGEMLELATGKPLGAAVRDLVGFERLGLKYTWFETLDSVPAGAPPRAHQYQDSLDTYAWDPSFDLYGGGGLVATIDDLAAFYRALLRGEVLANRTTLDTMLAPTPQSLVEDSTRGYGMGIGRRRFGSLVCWGHSGYWGTTASSCPATGLTIAAAMDRSPDRSFNAQAVVARAVELVGAIPAAGGR